MIETLKFSLENIITYKNVEIKLQKGINIIRGQNGSGKSLLFTSFATLIYGSHPLTVAKRDAKVLFTNKKSKINAIVRSQNSIWDISQFSTGKTVRYSLSKDGVEQKYRTIQTAVDKIRELVPISEEYYYSLIHLSSYRPHVLLNGKGPERHDFFEQIFNLSIYDQIQQKLMQKNSILQKKKQKLDILEEDLVQKKSLIPVNLIEKKNELKIITDRWTRLNSKLQIYFQELNNLNSYYSIYQELKTQYSLEELSVKLLRKKVILTDLEKKYEQAIRDDHDRVRNEENLKRKKILKNRLKKFSEDDLQTIIDQYKKNIKEFKEIKEKYDLQETAKPYFNKISNNHQKIVDYNKLLKLIALVENKIEESILFINKYSTLTKVSTCPTCGVHLEQKNIRQLISKYKKQVTLNEDKLNRLKNCLELAEAKNSLKKLGVTVQKDYSKRIKQLENTIKDLRDRFERAKEFSTIKKELDSIKIIKITCSPENFREKLSKLKEEISILSSDVLNKKKLENTVYNSVEQVIERRDKLTKFTEKNSFYMKKLSDDLQNFSSEIAAAEINVKNYKDLCLEVSKYKKETKYLDLYKTLIEIYGPRGLRTIQVENYCKVYVRRLNQNAHLLFNNQIKFDCIINKTNFSITAEHNNKPPADVSLLSGAESRNFRLLSLLSLLPLLPQSIRLNFCVLDEIEAGMDKDSIIRYCEFLKKLNEIVPCIYVVTPKSKEEFSIIPGLEYLVEKKNNISNIKYLG